MVGLRHAEGALLDISYYEYCCVADDATCFRFIIYYARHYYMGELEHLRTLPHARAAPRPFKLVYISATLIGATHAIAIGDIPGACQSPR